MVPSMSNKHTQRMPCNRFIALLRGINVGGHNKIPMSDLRSLCAEIGWNNVRSYIQSGNLVFSASAAASSLEADIEQAIERRFGLQITVVVRRVNDWVAYVDSNPFPDVAMKEPNTLMLGLSKATPKSNALKELRARSADGERLEQTGDALWLHLKYGAAKSKISPALLTRLVGSPVTVRNWRTVLKLRELAEHS